MKKTFNKIAASVMAAAALATGTVLYLCSCSKDSNNDYLIKNISSNQYNLVSNTYENGVIYVSYENESRFANFLDYETGQSVPLCNKPSCVHKDSSCLAFACLNKNPMVVAYQNSIIWFSSSVQIVDSEDGKSQTADINTTCWCGNLKTGEVKKFAEIPDVCMDSAKQIVIVSDTLYVIGCESAYQAEDGSWVQVSNIGNQYLYSIDDSGNVTTSPDITTDEYTNTTFVNEKLWKGSQNLCFDIKSKEDIKISKKFCDKNITVLSYYDDKYIVYYTDDEGKIYFEFVSEDELIGE